MLILRMRYVSAMDATALQAFRKMMQLCQHHKIELVITGINEQPKGVLEKAGLIDVIGADRFFATVEEALIYSKCKLGNPPF